jgi:hypothetical protein
VQQVPDHPDQNESEDGRDPGEGALLFRELHLCRTRRLNVLETPHIFLQLLVSDPLPLLRVHTIPLEFDPRGLLIGAVPLLKLQLGDFVKSAL